MSPVGPNRRFAAARRCGCYRGRTRHWAARPIPPLLTAELQASNLQLSALTAYSITSSARTSIEGGAARPSVLAVLARGARPNDLPVQLPAKLYPRA